MSLLRTTVGLAVALAAASTAAAQSITVGCGCEDARVAGTGTTASISFDTSLGDSCEPNICVMMTYDPVESTAGVAVVKDNIPSLFNGGADIPAGAYRLTYVSGCMRVSSGNSHLWSIATSFSGGGFGVQINGDRDTGVNPPGSIGFTRLSDARTTACPAADRGPYVPLADADPAAEAAADAAAEAACPVRNGWNTFEECEAGNANVRPVDFMHDGGTIGIYFADSNHADNVVGPRAPTWLLSRIDPLCM